MPEPGEFQSGEVVLLSFPFSDAAGTRRRPALVVLDTGDEDIILARVTSQRPRTSFDVEINEWQQAGLLLPSVARLDKLATLEKSLVERRLGEIQANDWTQIRAALQRVWDAI